MSFVNLENVCEDFLLLFQGSRNLSHSSSMCHQSSVIRVYLLIFPSESFHLPLQSLLR